MLGYGEIIDATDLEATYKAEDAYKRFVGFQSCHRAVSRQISYP